MKRYVLPTILVLSLIALSAGVGSEGEIDYDQVAEDIDVMARIIDKTLNKEFSEKYKVTTPGLPLAIFGKASGCQGIYLEGYGAVFTTSINMPVALQETEGAETEPEDMWEQTEQELKGYNRNRALPVVPIVGLAGHEKYDPEKVERLREELLRLIGTYGSRIRQLGPRENVVIAVHGTTEAASMYELGAAAQYGDVLVTHDRTGDVVTSIAYKAKAKKKDIVADIAYKLEEPAKVIVKIEDINGELIRTVDLGEQDAEREKSFRWDGKDDAGESVPSGVYGYKIEAGDSIVAEGKLVVTPKMAIVSSPKAVGLEEPTEPVTPQIAKVELNKGGPAHVIVKTTGAPVPKPFGGVAIGNTGRTTLIVKASKKSIMAYKDGSINFEGFMGQCETIQY